MSLQRLFDVFRSGGFHAVMVALALGAITAPVRAQQAWGETVQPAIAALSAVLMNPVTGEVLFAKEPHLRLPPASTTKVLTALVALERLDPNARVLVSPQAASAPPSRIGLRAGEAAATQDLLYGLMLKSGNDAAETLAEGAGGSVAGFADLMNAKAWQIGARNSHFMNPHGLPNEDHYSTAYDLALIFRQAMTHPLFADIVRTRSAALRIESGNGLYGDWRMVPVQSHNRLLTSYEGTLGGKTGFTIKARRCFVGEVDRGGVRLIVAVLNSPNSGALWNDARTLLDYGFARYGLASPPPLQPEPQRILVRREPVATPDEEDDREPMVQWTPPAPRVAAVRPPVRPVAPGPTALGLQQQRQVVPVQSFSAKPAVVAARTPAAVKPQMAVMTPVAMKTPVAVKTPVAMKTPVAVKTSAAARPVAVAKPSRPLVIAAIKPMDAPGKGVRPVAAPSKTTIQSTRSATTALTKPEKREITRTVARTEPPAKLQKSNAKSR